VRNSMSKLPQRFFPEWTAVGKSHAVVGRNPRLAGRSVIQRVGTEAPHEKKNYPTPASSRDRVARRNFKCRSVSEQNYATRGIRAFLDSFPVVRLTRG